MTQLDLNKAADFAALTMSNTNELLQAFARDKSRWAISESSYRGGRRTALTLRFHIFKSVSPFQGALPQVRDSGGRRKAKYRFPYVDGQTTDDMGRKPEEFDLEIVLYGDGYQRGLQQLMRELNDPIPGTLLHPVRGTIRCGMEDYQLTHSHSMNNAVMLTLRMTEHNFDFNDLFGAQTLKILSGLKSALQKAVSALQKVAKAIAAVRAVVAAVRSAIESIRQKIAEYYRFFQTILVDTNTVFNPDGGDDLASILPVQQGGLIAPVSAGTTAGGVDFGADPTTANTGGTAGTAISGGGFILVGTRFKTVSAPTDPFANVPLDLLSDVARQAIEVETLIRRGEVMRQMANEIMSDCESVVADQLAVSGGSKGLIATAVATLRQTRLDVLDGVIAMQNLIEQGVQEGGSSIIDYEVDHDMSVREASFLNGGEPQGGDDIAVLNRWLESVNLVPKGTIIKVPVVSR